MSVINQMLKDLDERKRPVSNTPYEPMMQQRQSQSKLPWVIVALLSLAIVGWGLKDLLPVNATEEANDNADVATAEKTEYDKVVATNNTDSQPDEAATEAVVTKSEKIALPEDIGAPKATINTQQSEPQEAESRVLKVSPQQQSRIQADELLAEYQQQSGTLSDAQYAEVLALDPNFHSARISWLSRLNQQNDDRFERQTMQAIQKWPEVYQYRQILARFWVMATPQKAYDLLMQQPPAIDKAPDYHGLIAYSAKQMGNLNLASKQYQLLLKSYPERADWWLALALAEDQLQRSASALRAYQQSLRYPGLAQNTQAYAEQRIKALQGF